MAKPKKSELVTARLLVDTVIDGKKHPCDALIAGDKKTIEALSLAGFADTTAEAITFRIENGELVVFLPASSKADDAADDAAETDEPVKADGAV